MVRPATQHDSVELLPRAIHENLPCELACAAYGLNPRTNDIRPLTKRIDKRAHPMPQRFEERLPRRAALLPQRAHHHTSEALFILDKLRQNTDSAQRIWRAAIDACK